MFFVTSLDDSGHPDEEACAVVKRQIDVEDVLGRDSTYCLDERGSPNPLVSDNGCFGQTCQGEKETKIVQIVEYNKISSHFRITDRAQ